MKRQWKSYLFVFPLIFFTLGFFNILFAWLGLFCMILPFVLLFKDRKKTWCSNYCPRANLFTRLFKGRSLTGKIGPEWLVRGSGKWYMLIYFSINLFVLTMSTIMVFKGRVEPVEQIRFLLAFPLPWDLPQMFNVGFASDWAIHLSYRIYSMMFTTTVLGLILGWLFYPRAWCRVCPVNTLSDLSLGSTKGTKSRNISVGSQAKGTVA